jgi:peptidoglycan/xylan/chitin deacetylase (PgdA/CDA1 family)
MLPRMSITRGEFLRSLGKSLPGMVASTGVATAAHAIFKRVAQASSPEQPTPLMTTLKPSASDTRVPFLHQGSADSSRIALTFDDGPIPGVTERILDALRAHDLHATFFMIGEKVAAAPELATRVLQEGHELGHHTYTHRKMTELSDADVEEELEKTDAIFKQVLGRRAEWFRPPFGALRQDQAMRVTKRNMKVAMWSVDSEDWRGGAGAEVTDRILTHLHPGAILLCHDVPVTAESLNTTLTRLRETQQYQLGTLSDLVRVAPPSA